MPFWPMFYQLLSVCVDSASRIIFLMMMLPCRVIRAQYSNLYPISQMMLSKGEHLSPARRKGNDIQKAV